MEGNRSWYYPTNNRNDLLALQQEQVTVVSGSGAAAEQEAEPLHPSEGLWGVELDGELVAVLKRLGVRGEMAGPASILKAKPRGFRPTR